MRRYADNSSQCNFFLQLVDFNIICLNERHWYLKINKVTTFLSNGLRGSNWVINIITALELLVRSTQEILQLGNV